MEALASDCCGALGMSALNKSNFRPFLSSKLKKIAVAARKISRLLSRRTSAMHIAMALKLLGCTGRLRT